MVNISTNRDEMQISKSIFDIIPHVSVPCVGITEESMEESPPGIGLCGWILTGLSLGLVLLTVPFSLFVCFKVQYSVRLEMVLRCGSVLVRRGRT